MDLILIAIFALVLLGGVDRCLHPQLGRQRTAAKRRASLRRHGSRASAPHRVAAGQVRPFLSAGATLRR